nr:hypothetical protein GCM10010200_062760 [Actinomadura rugatobispora]
MVVVLVLACLAVLGAVVALAMGLGGELSPAHRDHPPLRPPAPGVPPFAGSSPHPRLPRGLWGYQTDVADRAIDGIMTALHEREARMAALERQVTDLEGRLRERDHGGSEGRADAGEIAPPWASSEPGGIADVDLAKNNGGTANQEEARP